MDTLQAAIGDYQTFLTNIWQEIKAAGFDEADFVQLDHMCYRVPTWERYEKKKEQLMGICRLLGEITVNERPIAIFRFHVPIYYGQWRIDCIELPAPRTGTAPTEGLEHIELVIFDELDDFLKKYADKPFDLAAVQRGVNPEVGLKLPHYGVKFHRLNLATVVYLEQKLGLVHI